MMKSNRRDQIRFARVPYLADTEILEATYLSQVFGKHTHEEFAIGVVDAGSHVSEWGGATHRAGAGAVIVNNPGDVHTGRPGGRDGWSYRMLYPPAGLLTDVASQLADRTGRLPRFGAPVFDDAHGAREIGAIVHALLGGVEPLEAHSRFLVLFAGLLRRHAVVPPPVVPLRSVSRAVGIAREYLEAHLTESVSLSTLAELVGLHPLYLIRAFRRELGLPPHAYLIQQRVQLAKRRIASGESLTLVALATGFADQSHLSRHFRRIVGVPPGLYARAVGASVARAEVRIVQDGGGAGR
ncbi:MAG: AraC family transcriptional regulator [Gemmatimonadaceae bacterium]|nr:AraC family transcriptional regulator [Gemmatimonadaceae bacterium]